MIQFRNAKEWLVGAVAAVGLMIGATDAGAVTVIDDGDNVIINSNSEFIGDVDATGGAGSWKVTFTALTDPLLATATASLTNVVAGTFSDLVMSWIASSDDFVLATTTIDENNLSPSISTNFTDNGVFGGDDNPQYLLISWSDSLAGASFDVEVSAVPLPAGGLLLLTALGGMAAVRRRRKAA